jgi:SAM-dependent methyltransferase
MALPSDGSPLGPSAHALTQAADLLAGNDREFFARVWATKRERYHSRIESIGFTGLDWILDAGCGFGQWTWALAAYNARITAIDVDPQRVAVTRRLLSGHPAGRVTSTVASIDALPFADAQFNAIFCYGVVFIADTRRALAEFARVLRPGGRLYMTANALGWFLRCIVDQPNRSPYYDPRAMAIASLAATLDYQDGGIRTPDTQLVIPSRQMVRWLERAGFAEVHTGAEGTLVREGLPRAEPLFAGDFEGVECVYDVMAMRR